MLSHTTEWILFLITTNNQHLLLSSTNWTYMSNTPCQFKEINLNWGETVIYTHFEQLQHRQFQCCHQTLLYKQKVSRHSNPQQNKSILRYQRTTPTAQLTRADRLLTCPLAEIQEWRRETVSFAHLPPFDCTAVGRDSKRVFNRTITADL